MNSECHKVVKKKHKACIRYIHTLDRKDYISFKKFRNICTNVIKKTRRDFEHGVVRNIKDNLNECWSYVKHKTRSSEGVADLRTTSDDKMKANILNELFASVFVKEGDITLVQCKKSRRIHNISDCV